ncbi:glycosyltransferase family 2 protein [Agaribacterium haliotis]|uniref:glycosyltransferase family 2 protein n=1 Tax=Agaribacterium haliotis TaxID=2013869 RepID=UPI00130454C0|nr:glycosyltransferase family 2 protein [Agaribacterium haliotis]
MSGSTPEKALLQILIPTYARAELLEQNLNSLAELLIKLQACDDVALLISNNASPDHTAEVINTFSAQAPMPLQCIEQSTNIGLEPNALACLQAATAPYVMFLGDDDFLSEGYLKQVLAHVRAGRQECLCPSFRECDIDGVPFSRARDEGLGEKDFKPGFKALWWLAWRSHQMSGLCFVRAGVYETYRQAGCANLYPFVFFVIFSALNRGGRLLPQYPLRVTSIGQQSKDWSYGDDGLIDDFLQNYKKLPGLAFWARVALEFQFLRGQRWRYKELMIKNPGKFLAIVWRLQNASWVVKSYLFIYAPLKAGRESLKRSSSRSNGGSNKKSA